MKRSQPTVLITMLGILALVLTSCGSSSLTSTPAVELGYLYADNYTRMPTAFVEFEPGMVISAAYSPPAADNTARHAIYKETITYASGKTVEIEFFVVRSDADGTEYEASINGKVTQVPDIKEYLANIETRMQDKMAFTFVPYPGSWQQPLMKLPPLCEEAAEMHQELSKVDGKDWLNSLDTMTLSCPSTGKTTTLTFSYEREQASEPYITSFTVKIEQTEGK